MDDCGAARGAGYQVNRLTQRTRQRRFLRAVFWAGCWAAFSQPAGAQGQDAGEVEPFLVIEGKAPAPTGPADAGSPPAPDPAPVIPPAPQALQLPKSDQNTIVQTWRDRVEAMAGSDTVRANQADATIRSLREELGIENMLTPAAALVREAGDLILKHRASEANARCHQAIDLAPDYDGGHFCLARATFADEPSDLQAIFASLNDGVTVMTRDVRTLRGAVTDLGLMAVAAFVLACTVLVLLVILRHGRLGIHDFHHLFPDKVPWALTTLIAFALLLVPPLFGAGLFTTVAIAAVAVAMSASRKEAAAVAAGLLILAGAQFAASAVVRAGAFGSDAQDTYLLERGDLPASAAQRLQARADRGHASYATLFALGHYYKRLGRLSEARDAYEAARKLHETPELLNNIGNVEFLQGDRDKARKDYLAATQQKPSLAAPFWNIARIYFKETKMELGASAIKQARELDPGRASHMVGQDDMRANQYLVDVALRDDELLELADHEVASSTLHGWTSSAVTGNLGDRTLSGIALVAALLIGVARWMQKKMQPSTRCEKCGRPVCGRCDPELRYGGGLCGQCISVFVRRSGVDTPDRVRKELEVRHFRRRRRLTTHAAGMVIGGGGHILAGRILAGGIFLLLFCFLLSGLLFWHGLIRGPVPVDLPPTHVRPILYALGFLILYILSLVHLIRYEEAD
jgi:tetratricopeptide (TPR) repeat protein